jgi:hypothetical protein
MRKNHRVGLALVAVLAVCAFTATSAFATEWLLDGAKIAAATAATTEGLLFLITLVLGVTAVKLDCVGSFVGTVGPGATGTVTGILNSAGEEISKTALSGLALSCEVVTSLNNECGAVGGLAEVWAIKLPWTTTVELMTAGTENEFLIDFPATSGYEALCSNGKENTCEGLSSAQLLNLGAPDNDVDGLFGAAAESEKANCTVGGAGAGDLESVGGLTFVTGHTLAVSE